MRYYEIPRSERSRIVAAVNALDGSKARYPETAKSIATYAPNVIAIFSGVDPFLFRAVDDAIGNGNPDFRAKGYLVRRVRNHHEWGKKLFAALAH